MATKKHGGKRNGSGRKPVTDKKQAVFIYVKTSVIKRHKTKEALKAKLEADLNGVDN